MQANGKNAGVFAGAFMLKCVFFFIIIVLVLKLLALALTDGVEILVSFKRILADLDHSDRDVRAQVGDALEVGDDIVENDTLVQ